VGIFVQQYICQQLQQLGNVETHEFQVRANPPESDTEPTSNPSDKQKQPVLIGAHYDAVPGTPGADGHRRCGIAELAKIRS